MLIPTIAGLLGLLAFAVAELGSLFSEWVRERRQVRAEVSHLLLRLGGVGAAEAGEVLENSGLSPRPKRVLRELTGQASLSPPELRALARWLLSREEEHYAKVVNRTDVVARLGPMLGLMGTLIPLGPGLMALGQGNMEKLAQSLLIAFDTTVVGLAAGGIAFVISRIRKRWYEEYLSALEALMEALLEVLSGDRRAKEEKTLVGREGRGQSAGGRP